VTAGSTISSKISHDCLDTREQEAVFALKELDLAAEVMAECLPEDITATFRACESDQRLSGTKCGRSAGRLARELAEQLTANANASATKTSNAKASGAEAPAPASPALHALPELPALHEWLDYAAEPSFAIGVMPSPRCMELARLTWQSIQSSTSDDESDELSTHTEPPPGLLEAHASAFRARALAQHSRLAIEAIARGAWGTILSRRPWDCAQKLAETYWLRELQGQQAAQFILLHQTAVRGAFDFLAPLGSIDCRKLLVNDFEQHAEFVRRDLRGLLRDMGDALLPDLRGALLRGGLQALVVTGLEASVDIQHKVHAHAAVDNGEAQQLAECSEQIMKVMRNARGRGGGVVCRLVFRGGAAIRSLYMCLGFPRALRALGVPLASCGNT